MSQCIKNGEGLISKLTQSYDGMLLSNKKALTTKQNKTKLMVRKHQGETSSALGWAWESSLKGCTSHELTHVTFWKRLHALYRNRKHIGAAECWQWGDRADYSGPTGMFRGGRGGRFCILIVVAAVWLHRSVKLSTVHEGWLSLYGNQTDENSNGVQKINAVKK